jgi:hypothetical protein
MEIALRAAVAVFVADIEILIGDCPHIGTGYCQKAQNHPLIFLPGSLDAFGCVDHFELMDGSSIRRRAILTRFSFFVGRLPRVAAAQCALLTRP